jgi:hypothetical protein
LLAGDEIEACFSLVTPIVQSIARVLPATIDMLEAILGF